MEYVGLVIAVLVLTAALVAGFLVWPGERGPDRASGPGPRQDATRPTAGRPPSHRAPVSRGRPAPAPDQPAGGVATAEAPTTAAPPPTEPAPEPVASQVAVTPLETIAPTAGRLVRLRTRLSRSQTSLGRGLLTLLSRDRLDEDTWEEIEETLLAADMGVQPTMELVESLRAKVRVLGARTATDVRALLRDELLAQVGTSTDRSLHTSPDADRPAVLLVVGVNGTGKTTTCGKLARVLIADGHSVVLGAADTFRAAAADQLETWGTRVGAKTVRGPEGGDPASVAFDAVRQGIEAKADAVLIDTAGRLHTKAGLMDELGKVKRVVEKQSDVDEVLLVLDATTGQNAVAQARVFTEVVDVTGIVLTKLDGTAKGGIVVAVQRELGVPVKLVGLGEGPDDLAPFDAGAFVDALLGDEAAAA